MAREDATIESLSERQLECLTLASQHLRSEAIGHRIGRSKHTVDAHIRAAMQKIGVSDRDSAIRWLLAQTPTPGSRKTLDDFPRVALPDKLPATVAPHGADERSDDRNRLREAPAAAVDWGDSVPLLFHYRERNDAHRSRLVLIAGRFVVAAAAFGLLALGLKVLAWPVWWLVTTVSDRFSG